MRNLLFGTLALGVLLLGLLAQTLVAAPGADELGRYEGVTATATAVWVVDTRHGTVRKCTQEFADQVPSCSGFSD